MNEPVVTNAYLTYDDVRHNCNQPNLIEHGAYGERHQTIARWKCPECSARWVLRAEFLDDDRFRWQRLTNGSRRWIRAERRRRRKPAVTGGSMKGVVRVEEPSHACKPPSIRNEWGHGTVWRCDCGRRWKVYRGEKDGFPFWERRYLPW